MSNFVGFQALTNEINAFFFGIATWITQSMYKSLMQLIIVYQSKKREKRARTK